MNNSEVVYASLRFIENNIEEKLTAELVAYNVGYSKYHFSRMFKSTIGISISEYIKERRLICAAKDILNGQRVIDVALKYGYETHSGFDKAFKKKFGYPPKVLHVMNLAQTIFKTTGEIIMNSEELYERLTNTVNARCSKNELEQIDRAYQFACESHKNQRRYSGEPYVTHSLNVALILTDMNLPIETIILGILHDTLESKAESSFDELESNFGKEIAMKVKLISEVAITAELLDEDEDIILVKLGDRLHNMKTLENLDQLRWVEKAKETLSIFSPVAKSIGSIELKMELDHLSAKYMG